MANNTQTNTQEFNPQFIHKDNSIVGRIIAWVIGVIGNVFVKAGTKSVEVSVDAVHDMAVMAYKKKSAIDEVAKIVEKYGE